MAGGARPDPFRTRKLSRRAPMVLRGKPVGEQGAADRWTALSRRCGAGPSGPRSFPLFRHPFLISKLSIFNLRMSRRATLGDSATVRENRNLVLEAYRHSHAIRPFCINGFASMPTGVWSKRACRFRIGWHGRGDEKPFGAHLFKFSKRSELQASG